MKKPWKSIRAAIAASFATMSAGTLLADNFVVPTGTGTYKVYQAYTVGDTWNGQNTNAQAAVDPIFGTTGTGNLVRINSQVENDFVQRVTAFGGQWWMGASDQASEGAWVWTQGPAPTQFWQGDANGSAQNGLYTNWNGGEPNNSGGNENGGQFVGGNGRWNDDLDTKSFFAIREFNANASLIDATTTGGQFILDGLTGRYYQQNNTVQNWVDGKAAAESRQLDGVQGRLAVVDSAHVNQLFIGAGANFIGLTDSDQFGGTEFGNTSGDALPANGGNRGAGFGYSGPADVNGVSSFTALGTGYSNWNGGEPNDAGNEDYIEQQNNGGWNDLGGQSATSLIQYGTAIHAGLSASWTVTDIHSQNGMGSVNDGINLINGLIPSLSTTTGHYYDVNFNDREGIGSSAMVGDSEFPGNTSGDDNQFAIRASTGLVIPAAGDYTIQINQDDHYQLILNGHVFNQIACCGNFTQSVHFDAPGVYNLTTVMTEYGGGASLEISAAAGNDIVPGDPSFRLIGDVLSGGLSIAPELEIGILNSFTARTVFANQNVDNLSKAIELYRLGTINLSPAEIAETTGTTLTDNFEDPDQAGGTGHFGLNQAFPGQSAGVDDNNFVEGTSATVYVPSGAQGTYTFGINGDDGGAVRIDGINVILDDNLHGPQDAYGTFYLTPGFHTVDHLFFEFGGGAISELFYARGDFGTGSANPGFNGAFKLLSTIAGPTNQWNGATTGNYGDTTKWTGGVSPNGIGATALFNNNIPSAGTVTLNVPVTLGTLSLFDSDGYTLAGANALTLRAVAGGTAYINAPAGNNVISAPLVLASNTEVTTGQPTADIPLDTPYKLTLSGAQTWNAGVGLTVRNGTLTYNTTGIATVGGGNTLTINAGSQVQLGGAGNPLSGAGGAVNVVNNSGNVSTFAFGTQTLGLHVTNGSKTVGVISGTGVTSVDAGTQLVATKVTQSVLSIAGSSANDTAKVSMVPSAPVSPTPSGQDATVSHLTSLNIANDGGSTFYGTLDLGNNDLIIDSNQYAQVLRAVTSGFNGSAWDGKGIASSVAADSANPAVGYTAIGVLYNDDDLDPNTTGGVPFTSSFDGVALIGNETLVKFTYYGDANLDGVVDFIDYGFIDAGIAGAGTGWAYGDFNYDGFVDFIDYGFIDAGVAGTGQFGQVPEPSSIALLGLGALGLVGARLRKRVASRQTR